MTEKAILAKAWKRHRELFRPYRVSSTKCVIVDKTLTPPYAVTFFLDGKLIRGAEVNMAGDVPVKRLVEGIGPYYPDARTLSFQEVIQRLGIAPGAMDLARVSVERFQETLGDPVLAARLPIEELVNSERIRLRKGGIDELLEQVNVDALEALKLAEGIEERDYNFYAAPGELGIIRRQAAQVYPLLAPMFSRRISLEDAIDQKASLVDAIEAAYTPAPGPGSKETPSPLITKAALGRLRGMMHQARGLAPNFIAQIMTELPPDWFPKKASDLRLEDWEAFTDLVSPAVFRLAPLSGTPLTTLLEGCAGRWEALRDRVVRGFTDSRPPLGADESLVEHLKGEIPWKAIKELPKWKVPAAAKEIARTLEGDLNEVPREAIADWIIRLEAPQGDRHAITAACAEAEMIAETFANKVLLPLATYVIAPARPISSYANSEAAKTLAGKILFGGKSMVAVCEMIREFRAVASLIASAGAPKTELDALEELRKKERVQAKENAILRTLGVDPDKEPGPNDWPALTSIVQAPNGLWLVPLTSDRAVHEEGSGPTYANRERENPDGSLGLDLCLGAPSYRSSYVTRCQRDGGHLISVRHAADPHSGRQVFERVATAQLSEVSVEKQRFLVTQYMAKTNTRPSQEADRAMEWYRHEILSGRLPINQDALLTSKRQAIAKLDPIKLLCDYEWRDERHIQSAMAPWGKFVPKRIRQLGFEGFKNSPEMHDLIEFIEPGTHRRLARARDTNVGAPQPGR
jgi:hypothetical protein